MSDRRPVNVHAVLEALHDLWSQRTVAVTGG